MSSGDSAVWPLLASDLRVTIPDDMRASLEAAYVHSGPTRFCPPPPRPTSKAIAVWLALAVTFFVALGYMAQKTGSNANNNAPETHRRTARQR